MNHQSLFFKLSHRKVFVIFMHPVLMTNMSENRFANVTTDMKAMDMPVVWRPNANTMKSVAQTQFVMLVFVFVDMDSKETYLICKSINIVILKFICVKRSSLYVYSCVPTGSCGGAFCAENAICQWDNTERISYCFCPPGFVGDGLKTCKSVPPACNVRNICGLYASCTPNYR